MYAFTATCFVPFDCLLNAIAVFTSDGFRRLAFFAILFSLTVYASIVASAIPSCLRCHA